MQQEKAPVTSWLVPAAAGAFVTALAGAIVAPLLAVGAPPAARAALFVAGLLNGVFWAIGFVLLSIAFDAAVFSSLGGQTKLKNWLHSFAAPMLTLGLYAILPARYWTTTTGAFIGALALPAVAAIVVSRLFERVATGAQYAFIMTAALAHVAMYVGFGYLPKEKKYTSVAIAMAEAKKEKEREKPPPPPPPKRAPEKSAAAKAKELIPETPKPVETPKDTPPPKTNSAPVGDSMTGFQDLGLGDFGGGGGGGAGFTVPMGNGGGGGGNNGAPTTQPTTQKTVKQLQASDPGCTDDLVKATLEGKHAQPAYPAEAQKANIEGKVKLELTIDASGRVTNVRVLAGIGFGCDEAAVAAARQWTFKPATKCGKPVPSTIKASVPFELK